jgi:lysyl-tRNA synthetase class 1
MLLNLASVAGTTGREGLWGFLRRYAPDASPEGNPDLDAAVTFALRYFGDKIAPARKFRLPDEKERAAIEDLRGQLAAWDGPVDDEAIQTAIYAIGKAHGFDPLRDWFKALYEVLLGASEGPRFGGFVALYGVQETVGLIDRALAGELAG